MPRAITLLLAAHARRGVITRCVLKDTQTLVPQVDAGIIRNTFSIVVSHCVIHSLFWSALGQNPTLCSTEDSFFFKGNLPTVWGKNYLKIAQSCMDTPMNMYSLCCQLSLDFWLCAIIDSVTSHSILLMELMDIQHRILLIELMDIQHWQTG